MVRALSVLFAAVLCGSVFAGCADGRGGIGEPIPGSTAAPSASATYKQKVIASRPYSALTCINQQGVGAQTWTGTISQTLVQVPAAPGASSAVVVTSTIALDGCADGSDTSIETDSYTGHALQSAVLSAYTSRFSPNAVTQILFPVPGGIARTLTQGGETLTVHADGSYNDASVGGNTLWPYDAQTIVQNADGSGSDTTVAGANASAPPYIVTYSAPVNGVVTVSTQGTPPVDPVLPTATPCAGSCPSPSPTPNTFAAWYPFTPSASQPLERISSIDKGTQTIPQSCTMPAGMPSSAALTETTDTALDIWRGIGVATTDAYADSTHGLLCAIVTVTRSYYDLQVPGPHGSDTLTAIESLQSESGPIAPFSVPAPARFIELWR